MGKGENLNSPCTLQYPTYVRSPGKTVYRNALVDKNPRINTSSSPYAANGPVAGQKLHILKTVLQEGVASDQSGGSSAYDPNALLTDGFSR